MKISLGMNLQPGPWGGGNQFGRALSEYLKRRGVEVRFDLSDSDIDLIMLTEPRSSLKSSAYSAHDIVRYLRQRNRRAVVVHRVNECDERKGTTGVNRLLMRANDCADHTVFISAWLRVLFEGYGWESTEHSVILNGGDDRVFNAAGYRRWDGSGKIRLVTHHWGGGWFKGFDIYGRLDAMLSRTPFAEMVDFTYIGNLPRGFRFERAQYIPPLNGAELAQALRRHHVYLTASQNEPAGMHHIEGALSGLPLLYRRSGALPEYCNGFGVSFAAENFEQRLQEMVETYHHWADRMDDYPYRAGRMCGQYYELFTDLLDRRDEIIEQRQWWRQPALMLDALLPHRAASVFQWFNKLSGLPS